jgi:hypothetical protein
VKPVKYFFVNDSQDKRHIVVARDQEEAESFVTTSGIIISDIYELIPETFNIPGFLISDE